MNMTPLKFDELNNLLILDDVAERTTQEISKDSLLEKLVQLSVSYFCVGTEIRFILQKSASSKFTMRDSEIYHAKSLHTATCFLPAQCPLIGHVMSSYVKHHIKKKPKQEISKIHLTRQVKERQLESKQSLQSSLVST